MYSSALALALAAAPLDAVPADGCPEGMVHTVLAGDTLWDLTRSHYVCTSPGCDTATAPAAHQLSALIRRIHSLNRATLHPDPHWIYPQQHVCLPATVSFATYECHERARPVDEEPAAPDRTVDADTVVAEPEPPGDITEPSGAEPEYAGETAPEPPAADPAVSASQALSPDRRTVRVGFEFQLGTSLPLGGFLYKHVHPAIPSGSLALRIALPGDRVRIVVRILGSLSLQQRIWFNEVPQRQRIGQLGGAGEVWVRFAGKRTVEGHVGVGAGGLWLRRELARTDLPIAVPERQGASSLFGLTALRAEFVLDRRRLTRIPLTVSVTHMAMHIDDIWAYVPQLNILGGFAREF